MHAAGYQNTVALCGSALSDEQIELLKKYARRVSLVLDGDEAGQNAAARIEKQLADAGFMVMNCLLPEGEDPDSLFHRYGKEGFCTIFRESAYNRRVKKFGGTLDDESGDSDIRVALFCDDELEVIALHQQNQVERPRLERLEAEIRMEMDHLMGILFYTTNKPERAEVLQKLVHASKRLNILYKELNRPHGTYNKQISIK